MMNEYGTVHGHWLWLFYSCVGRFERVGVVDLVSIVLFFVISMDLGIFFPFRALQKRKCAKLARSVMFLLNVRGFIFRPKRRGTASYFFELQEQCNH